jgi:hypothetical protein
MVTLVGSGDQGLPARLATAALVLALIVAANVTGRGRRRRAGTVITLTGARPRRHRWDRATIGERVSWIAAPTALVSIVLELVAGIVRVAT